MLYASANGDATKQVDNIQQLASQDPDAMVVVPMGPGIKGQVAAAANQKIPVVLCAGRLEGNSGAISTVARSYELQATLWAEWVVKQLDGKGRVAMLSGIAGVPTAEYQKAAAEKVFDDSIPASRSWRRSTPTGRRRRPRPWRRRSSSKDLDAIWSDSGISDLGVVEAYERAGKPVPPLTGDSSNAFLKAVDGKDVKFALSPFPPEQSTQCLDVALDALAGKKVPNVVNVEAAGVHRRGDRQVHPQGLHGRPVDPDEPARRPLLKKLKLC